MGVQSAVLEKAAAQEVSQGLTMDGLRFKIVDRPVTWLHKEKCADRKLAVEYSERFRGYSGSLTVNVQYADKENNPEMKARVWIYGENKQAAKCYKLKKDGQWYVSKANNPAKVKEEISYWELGREELADAADMAILIGHLDSMDKGPQGNEIKTQSKSKLGQLREEVKGRDFKKMDKPVEGVATKEEISLMDDFPEIYEKDSENFHFRIQVANTEKERRILTVKIKDQDKEMPIDARAIVYTRDKQAAEFYYLCGNEWYVSHANGKPEDKGGVNFWKYGKAKLASKVDLMELNGHINSVKRREV